MKRIFFYCFVSALSFLIMSTSCSKNEAGNAGTTGDPSPPDNYNINVTTFAGKAGVPGFVNGKGDITRFSSPGQMVFDERNQILYVADQGFNGLVIRALDLSGNVSTYVEPNSLLNSIGDIALAPGIGGNLYLSSTSQDAIFSVTNNGAGKGIIARIAGFAGSGNSNGTSIATASFDGPRGIVTGPDGTLYVGNEYYNTIRKVSFAVDKVMDFAGKPAAKALDPGGFTDGAGRVARFNGLHDMALSSDGSFLVVPDYSNHALRKVMLADGRVSSYFGDPLGGLDQDGPFATAEAGNPEVAVFDKNNNVYFTSFLPGGNGKGTKIRVAHLDNNTVFTIAGGQGPGNLRYQDGTGAEARFNGIKGIAITGDGKILFVSDMYNHCIRKITLY